MTGVLVAAIAVLVLVTLVVLILRRNRASRQITSEPEAAVQANNERTSAMRRAENIHPDYIRDWMR